MPFEWKEKSIERVKKTILAASLREWKSLFEAVKCLDLKSDNEAV